MLQRAASNAYSWWWASHVRTKQSKWLEENLQDMEEKVTITLKIVNDDGDSFAQRAEMYYRKRPELINFIEDSYRAYRALAERYDHLSRELQSANRTIATAFPERVQYAMADDDEENASQTSTSSDDPNNPAKGFPADSKSSIPNVPKIPIRSPSRLMSRKGSGPLRRMASSTKAASTPSSGLSKSQALGEIDNLQKGILAMQTEKEFVKSMYDHGYQKYWDIENQITEMQKTVCSLQEEFGIGTMIEDNEARTLMAATALKSCQETLDKLQEKQGQYEEEARVENQRIKEADEKFESIKDEFLSKNESSEEFESTRTKLESKSLDEESSDMAPERQNLEMLKEKIKEQLDMNPDSSLTMTELAEKIDALVNKVATLETSVSTQTSLVQTLKSETDGLHGHVQSLEEDKETLMESTEYMSKKLKELEEELRRVKILNQSVLDQNNKLQTHFTEASCNLDHLSSKLQTVKQDEDVEENTTLFQKTKAVPNDAKPEKESAQHEHRPADDDDSISTDVIEKKDGISEESKSVKGEEENQSEPSNSHGLVTKKLEESMQQDEEEEGKRNLPETEDSDPDGKQQELEAEKEESQPNWRQLFLKGLEDREKILLEEYTTVLQDYKEVRKKLGEVENKNRDSIFELAMQVRELKHHIASKDDEIKCLQHKFSSPGSNPNESPFTCNTEYKYTNLEAHNESLTHSAHSPYSGAVTPSQHMDESASEAGEQHVQSMEKFTAASLMKEKKKRVSRPHSVSTIEDRFRLNIDELLEENLEFWLRFSTSVHQIQKFKTSIDDLQLELSNLMEKKKQEGPSSNKHYLQSEARPIYRHLREIKTELSLWLEHNAVLKDELEGRFTSLCNIQEEVSRLSNASSSKLEKTELSDYQAAKFQGEILNMKQENNKVVEGLQVGLNRVKAFKVQVEETLSNLDEELGIPLLKNSHPTMKQAANKVRIPLRSFLFGVKLKRQKPSIFSCVSPSLQKQYSDLAGVPPT